MKLLLIILFLFFNLIASGTKHYVKNGGNDALSGADDANAWATISKVNGHTYIAGDSILFKCGDRFEGTLIPPNSGTAANRIVFGSYGTGIKPIITPDVMVAGLTWTIHSGSIYKTTDIPYNPGNMLKDGTTKINKINDTWFATTPTDGRYSNLKSLDLMASTATKKYYIAAMADSITFWDGLDALYCYNSGTTYIRFKGGDDPNTFDLYTSVENGSAVYVNNKHFITFQNLKVIGGEYGFDLYWIDFDDTDNIIIENCYISDSNKKIYIHNGYSRKIVIRNDTLTNNFLSTYEPGAWVDGTEYIHVINCHYYEFFKYRVSTSTSPDADSGVDFGSAIGGYISQHDNVVLNCINALCLGQGTDNAVYNNKMENGSSEAVACGVGAVNAQAYNNEIINFNIPFRFQYIDDAVYPNRTVYIYKNRVYIPDAGELIYIHYGSTGAATIQAYIYHNSIICKIGIMCSSTADNYPPNGTGFVFVNNIISASGDNSGQYSFVGTADYLYEYFYNWTGGIFHGASGLPGGIAAWATDASNLNNVGDTFWDHSVDPPTYAIEGTEALDAGIDISQAFVLGGINYSALPGFSPGYEYGTAPDLGYYEYDGGVPPVVPSVSTMTPFSINIEQGSGGGNITYAGEGTIDDCGLCWSTSADPDVTDSHTHCGCVGLGSFTGTITGLSSNTTYHLKAFAHNETGYGYGVEIEFTTPKWNKVKYGTKIVTYNGKPVIVR